MIKKYDELLFIDKRIDGKKILKRKSPIYRTVSYDILDIENQYIGSERWLLDKIKRMDSRRIDFFSKPVQENLKARRSKKTDSRIHEDVASYMQEGNKIIV